MTVCLDAFEVSVTDQPTLSEFIVSPTLTHGPINITDRSNKGLSVDVLDAYGKIVLRTRTDQGENRIHLDHLASGTYIIRCRRSDGEFNAVRVLKH